MTDIFIKWIYIVFGVSLALFTIQPWSISVANIPLQVFMVWGVFVGITLFKPLQTVNALKSCGYFVLILVAIMIMSVGFRSILDINYLKFLQLLTGVVILFLSSTLIVDGKRRKYILYPIVFSATLSSFVAILQSVGLLEFTWSRTLYHMSSIRDPSGLEMSPVALLYSLLGIGVFNLCYFIFYLRNKGHCYIEIKPFISFLFVIFFILGVYVSESRSGMGGLCIALFVATIIMKRINKRFLNMFIGGGIVIYFSMVVIAFPSFQSYMMSKITSIQNDERAVGTWSVFLPVIFKYPMGVPNQLITSSHQSLLQKNAYLMAIRSNGGYDPHNFILTSMLFFGIPTGLSLLFIYFYLIIRVVRLLSHMKMNASKNDSQDEVILIFLFVANMAILFHSYFHNANLAMGEMRNWFWVGSTLGIAYSIDKKFSKRR